MEHVLVVGVESWIGANLALCLTGEFRVTGWSRRVPYWLEGCEIAVGEERPHAAAKFIGQRKPDAVIYVSEIAASSWEVSEPREGLVREAEQVLDASAECGAHATVLSTDAVFATGRMFHDEHEPPTARDARALAARRIEQRAVRRGALVARSHLYGWSPSREEGSPAESWRRQLVDRQPVTASGNDYATPLLVSDLAPLWTRARRAGLKGIWHLAGAERVSQRQFVEQMTQALAIERPRAPEGQMHAGPDEPPRETSLSSRRSATALGGSLPLLAAGLQRFAAQLDNGHRQRLREGWPAITVRRAA